MLQFKKNEKKSPDGSAVQKYQKQILKQWYVHYWHASGGQTPLIALIYISVESAVMQNCVASVTNDTPPGVSKNPEDQTEDYFGELER